MRLTLSGCYLFDKDDALGLTCCVKCRMIDFEVGMLKDDLFYALSVSVLLSYL